MLFDMVVKREVPDYAIEMRDLAALHRGSRCSATRSLLMPKM